MLTIPAGGGTYDMSVSIEIYNDNIQESEEAFLLYMESDNTQQVEITRNVSLARIRADSDCKFSFCHMSICDGDQKDMVAACVIADQPACVLLCSSNRGGVHFGLVIAHTA